MLDTAHVHSTSPVVNQYPVHYALKRSLHQQWQMRKKNRCENACTQILHTNKKKSDFTWYITKHLNFGVSVCTLSRLSPSFFPLAYLTQPYQPNALKIVHC